MDIAVNLSNRQKTIAGLTVATAVIHFILAFIFGNVPLFFGLSFLTLFILNGLGYLALLTALYFLPQMAGQRAMVRWVLLGFTAVTFIAYFVANWPAVWFPSGIVVKLIELVLMVLLWQDK